MTKQVKGPRTRIPDYYEQDRIMRSSFPQFRRSTFKDRKAWRGVMAPDPGSTTYEILVEYRGPRAPRVYVLSPELGRCKHRYKEGHLCLFYPRDPGRRWEQDSIVALTILPWTASWLHFHELYLETGEWLGPEVEHLTPTEKRDAS